MRITLYKTKTKLLQYDTGQKLYVIRFIIDSVVEGGKRYTLANNLKRAIYLIKKGYH